ncbi:unnamed protein product [Owenia fusiformis]|uniref:Uncharacterized protein n=1 Tax=Owenia fusiformis TaxID=6347 RepID=A0A8J1TRX5_OWEFU|nr:unnamed protein product [Owenia fusiformis]
MADYHGQYLDRMCRLCGKSTNISSNSKKRPPMLCKYFKERILEHYSIDISIDDDKIHTQKIFQSCVNTMLNSEKKGANRPHVPQEFFKYVEHCTEDCIVCKVNIEASRPGRKKESKKGKTNGTG